MTRLAPKSLAGQLALLVGIALFVAQAINFALLLGEARERRTNLALVPAVVRLVNAAERHDLGRRPPRRVALTDRSGIAPALNRPALIRDVRIEARARAALAEAGLTTLDVHAARAARTPGDRPRRNRSPHMLVVSARIAPATWATVRVPMRGREAPIVWRLLGQTAILYLVLLTAVLWIGRRAARPLRDLTAAASAFGRSGPADPLAQSGPADIRGLTAAFNAMRDRLAATLTQKDRMLGAIGHDLRTPLASLRLRIEAVEDGDERARMADTIAEMSQTLDDILSLARVGHSEEPVSKIDLAALADAVVEDLRDLGGDISFKPSPRLALDLRPVLTRRAIRNLAENALKYGGRATVRVRRDGNHALVEIGDRGSGLPPHMLDAVFDDFTRGDQSRNRDTGGAGLGLALARAIVRDQGGDITLVNRASGGLTATLRLPL